jgi:hypothetical protein
VTTLPPPTIDRRTLVRLRLQQHKCPGCGGRPTGKRVCCIACTAAGLRYCGRCEAVLPWFRHNWCPACTNAERSARYYADLAAGRAAQRRRHNARMAQAGRIVESRAAQIARGRQIARRAALRWALGEPPESIAADLGITPHALRLRWGRLRRAERGMR